MQATLKDVGKVKKALERFPLRLGYGYFPTIQRCELVPLTESDAMNDKDWMDFVILGGLNALERHCRIGRVHVAKWMALDPVEARTDQMEPPLGSELT